MTRQVAASAGTTESGQLSSGALTFGGIILIGLGLYFIFIRPALLPEDPRFMGTTLEHIRVAFPGLLLWLPRVFWVMGGYMVSTLLGKNLFSQPGARRRLDCSAQRSHVHRIDGRREFHHRL